MFRIALAVALPLVALSPAHAAEQSFMVTDFDAVTASGAHKVVVTTGKAPSVRAVGERDDLDRLEVKVEGRTLKLGTKRSQGWVSWNDAKPVTIFVTGHKISSARLAGSGDMAIDRVNGDDVKLSVAGSGDLSIGIVKATSLDVSVAGSGDLAMTGTCDTAKVSVAGSGNVAAAGLKCQALDGKVAGSGDITIEASKSASAKVAGSGNIVVKGSAKCSASTTGSGRVTCGDEG